LPPPRCCLSSCFFTSFFSTSTLWAIFPNSRHMAAGPPGCTGLSRPFGLSIASGRNRCFPGGPQGLSALCFSGTLWTMKEVLEFPVPALRPSQIPPFYASSLKVNPFISFGLVRGRSALVFSRKPDSGPPPNPSPPLFSPFPIRLRADYFFLFPRYFLECLALFPFFWYCSTYALRTTD